MSDKGDKDINAPFMVHMFHNGNAFMKPVKVGSSLFQYPNVWLAENFIMVRSLR